MHGRSAETHLINVLTHLVNLTRCITNEDYVEIEVRQLFRELVETRGIGREVFVVTAALFDELNRLLERPRPPVDDVVLTNLTSKLRESRENLQAALDQAAPGDK